MIERKDSRIIVAGLFLVAGLLLQAELGAQSYMIRGEITYASGKKIYLAAYEKDHFVIRDSVDAAHQPFLFVLPEDNPPGIYRLIYDEVHEGLLEKGRMVEFVVNGEDLNIYVDRDSFGPVPQFESSQENAVYQEFTSYQLEYEEALSGAYRRLFPSLPGDAAWMKAVQYYEHLQVARLQFIDSLAAANPDLYTTRLILAFRVPVIPGHLEHRQRIDTLKQVFFQLAPLDDPSLLHAPVYTFRMVDFLSIFQDPGMDAEAQEKSFKKAVDLIMVNVGEDPVLRSFVVEYLLQGFELLGLEAVQLHIADNYLDEQCTSDAAELVKDRMEGYRAMESGQQAPDFVIRDVDGRNHTLSQLSNEHVLVLFWSTTCPHCKDMLPRLKQWYMEENTVDLEVVALSIDTSEQHFLEYVEGLDFPWISARESLGWTGKVAEAYHIYATPAMFLLDGERRIVSRPVSYRQFLRAIRPFRP